MVATVSDFLTVGSSHPCIPNSKHLLLAGSSRFGKEEPAVRKALAAATTYPAFRMVNAEPGGGPSVDGSPTPCATRAPSVRRPRCEGHLTHRTQVSRTDETSQR